jgi:gliding motility-associated protein GldC
MIKKNSEITVKIGSDENNNPLAIQWMASDSGINEFRESKAMFLSFWDVKENNSMRIDLWNKDLMVEEMYFFIYQNMVSMSETLARATNDSELSQDMQDFAAFFAKKSGIIK